MPDEGDNGQQDPNARGQQSDQGQRGDQGEGRSGRVGQGSSRYGSLGSRQGDIQQQLQSLIDRMRMEGAEAPQQFEGAGKSMKEAKGKRFAISRFGSLTDYLTRATLQHFKLDPKDVTVLQIGSTPARYAALTAKAASEARLPKDGDGEAR